MLVSSAMACTACSGRVGDMTTWLGSLDNSYSSLFLPNNQGLRSIEDREGRDIKQNF